MRLIAITGMRHDAKVRLIQSLIASINLQDASLTLLDNGDEPLKLDAITRQRLAGGCVCCSLAAALIPIVWRLETDYALLLVSASADPETLARLLDSWQGTQVEVRTLALIDAYTHAHFPYLAQRLGFYATHPCHEPFDFAEVADAALRI